MQNCGLNPVCLPTSLGSSRRAEVSVTVSLAHCWIPRAMPTPGSWWAHVWMWVGEQSCFCRRESGCRKQALPSAVLAQLLLPGWGKESTLREAWNREGRARVCVGGTHTHTHTQQGKAKGGWSGAFLGGRVREPGVEWCGGGSRDGRKGWLAMGLGLWVPHWLRPAPGRAQHVR